MSENEAEAPEAPARQDATTIIESFTGWDEIAIEQAFKMSFARMGQSTMALRSVQFIVNRRAGLDDKAAFRDAMDTRFGTLNERYNEDDRAGDDGAGDDEPGEA